MKSSAQLKKIGVVAFIFIFLYTSFGVYDFNGEESAALAAVNNKQQMKSAQVKAVQPSKGKQSVQKPNVAKTTPKPKAVTTQGVQQQTTSTITQMEYDDSALQKPAKKEMTVMNDVYADSAKADKRIVREDKAKRTNNSKHYLLADGSYKAEISTGTLHYEDGNGEFQDINTNLIDEGDIDLINVPISKEVANEAKLIIANNKNKRKNNPIDKSQTDFRAMQVPFDVKIPKDYSKGYSIGKGTNQLKFIPIGASHVPGNITRNEAQYTNAWTDSNVRLEVTNKGIKETIILQSKQSPNVFSFEVQGLLKDDLTAGELHLEPAWLKDANGVYRDVKQKVRREVNGKVYVDLEANVSDLVYPIEIDPTTSINNTSAITDAQVANNHTTTNYGNDISIMAGGDTFALYRSFIRVDLSSIPANAIISASTLNLKSNGGYIYLAPTVYFHQVTSSWNESTVTWSNQPSFIATAFASMNVTANSTYYSINVNSLLPLWFSGALANNGIVIKSATETSTINYLSFWSSEYTSTNVPYFTVTYNEPPNALSLTSPNGGEVWDASNNIVWNASTDSDTVQSNLKYQIQLSINGGSTWTDIIALTGNGITSYAHNFSAVTESNNSLIRIRAYDGVLYSPWDQSNAPFTIQHNHAPNSPINLTPGSSSSATPVLVIPVPTLNWTFSDSDSGDTQSAFDVTIYAGTSLLYDSGWLNGNAASFSIPTSANLVRGTIYNWKVATKDSKGLLSPQSIAMYIKINSLPTTAITSYADGQTVPDNILVFNWNYSDINSQAQSSYQIQGSQNGFSTITYDSGLKSGSAISFTTPPLASGNWSFRIRTHDGMEWSSWSNRNNLILPNSLEPNNDTASAFPILYANTYSTYISTVGDVDYFKYTATANGIDRIILSSVTAKNYDVYVYDVNNNLVAAGVNGGSIAENMIFEVINGMTYYVKVLGVGGDFSASTTYSLTLNALTIKYQTDYQYDDNGNIKNSIMTRIN